MNRPSPHRRAVPTFWPESPDRHRARAILAYLAGDHALPLEARLDVLDALDDLDEFLPAGVVLQPVDPYPGGFQDAHRLLQSSWTSNEEPSNEGTGRSVRDILAAAQAAARLRPWLPQPTSTQA